MCHVHFHTSIHFILPTTLSGRHYDYSHFTDGKIEAQRPVKSLKFTPGDVAAKSELRHPVKRV